MRDPTRAIASYSLLLVAALVGGGCAPRPATVVDPSKDLLPLIERERSVSLPDSRSGELTQQQKDEYDRGRRIVSHVRQRCAGPYLNARSKQCNRTVNVLITAVEGAKFVRWDRPPNRPQLLAWIENLGAEPTTDGLLPGKQARYALVADATTHVTGLGPRPRLVLVEILDPEAQIARRRTRVIEHGAVFACHNYHQPYISDADFRPCHNPLRVAETGPWNGPLMVTSLLTFVSFFDDPTWLSCASGCCTSQQPN